MEGKRGKKSKQLLDDSKDKRNWILKYDALGRILW
jgi:hypothetical protein